MISASILSADQLNLKTEIAHILSNGADWIHIDVMDGDYVPNLTFGLPLIESIRKAFPKAFLDVHIMVSNPDETALWYAEKGANMVTFHIDRARHPHRMIHALHEKNCKAGIALNPGQSLHLVQDLIPFCDLILLMSVNPGFSGQKFIPQTFERISTIKQWIDQSLNKPIIQIDGGVSDQNAKKLRQHGASCLVAGSFLFGNDAEETKKRIASLR